MEYKPGEQQSSQSLMGWQIIRGSLWLWIQVAANMLLFFLFSWIILHQLTPAGFGQVILVQSILDVANLGTLNLETALQRFIPEYRSGKRWQAARVTTAVIFWLKFGMSGLAVLIIFLAAPAIARFYDNPDLAIWLRLGCLSLFFAGLTQFGAALCLGLLRPEISAITAFVQRTSEIFLLIFMLGNDLGVAGVILALGIGDTIAALSTVFWSFRFLGRDPAESPEKIQLRSQVKSILAYSLPLLGGVIVDRSGQNLNKLLIGKLAGPALLGLYGVARLVIERMLPFLAQAPQMSVAVLAQKWTGVPGVNHEPEILKKIFRYQWSLGSLSYLIIWIVAPLFVSFVSGEEYLAAVPILRLAGILIIFWSGLICFHTVFLLYRRTLGGLWANIIQFLVTYLIYLVFLPSSGIYGAVVGDISGILMALIFCGWLTYKWFNIEILSSNRALFGQMLLLVVLLAPLWYITPDNQLFWWLWVIITFYVFGSYLLMTRVPSPEDLLFIQKLFKKPGRGQRILFGFIAALAEYQNNTLNLIEKIQRSITNY